ncbi:hypothetical protein OQA88_858 [Cercophora sp. LCS_1]
MSHYIHVLKALTSGMKTPLNPGDVDENREWLQWVHRTESSDLILAYVLIHSSQEHYRARALILSQVEDGVDRGRYMRVVTYNNAEWFTTAINHRLGWPLDTKIMLKLDLENPQLAVLYRNIIASADAPLDLGALIHAVADPKIAPLVRSIKIQHAEYAKTMWKFTKEEKNLAHLKNLLAIDPGGIPFTSNPSESTFFPLWGICHSGLGDLALAMPYSPGPIRSSRLSLTENKRGDAVIDAGVRLNITLLTLSQFRPKRKTLEGLLKACVRLQEFKTTHRIFGWGFNHGPDDAPSPSTLFDLLTSSDSAGTLEKISIIGDADCEICYWSHSPIKPKSLSEFPALAELTVGFGGISVVGDEDSLLNLVKGCKRLEVLRVRGVRVPEIPGGHALLRFANHAPDWMPKLRELKLDSWAHEVSHNWDELRKLAVGLHTDA